MAPDDSLYMVRLLLHGKPRRDGAWYYIALDWRPGGDLDSSNTKLVELFRRLTTADNANRHDLDFYELEIKPVPDDGQTTRWVPTNGDDSRRGRR